MQYRSFIAVISSSDIYSFQNVNSISTNGIYINKLS